MQLSNNVKIMQQYTQHKSIDIHIYIILSSQCMYTDACKF